MYWVPTLCQELSWLLCFIDLKESSQQYYGVSIAISYFLEIKKLRFRTVSNMSKVTQLAKKKSDKFKPGSSDSEAYNSCPAQYGMGG